MAATKDELEEAFTAGIRYAQDDYAPAPASVPDFAEWYANFAHERRVSRALAKAQKKARALALVAECRRRSNINLAEADRPSPPYTTEAPPADWKVTKP
jgi:hypothetical protein